MRLSLAIVATAGLLQACTMNNPAFEKDASGGAATGADEGRGSSDGSSGEAGSGTAGGSGGGSSDSGSSGYDTGHDSGHDSSTQGVDSSGGSSGSSGDSSSSGSSSGGDSSSSSSGTDGLPLCPDDPGPGPLVINALLDGNPITDCSDTLAFTGAVGRKGSMRFVVRQCDACDCPLDSESLDLEVVSPDPGLDGIPTPGCVQALVGLQPGDNGCEVTGMTIRPAEEDGAGGFTIIPEPSVMAGVAAALPPNPAPWEVFYEHNEGCECESEVEGCCEMEPGLYKAIVDDDIDPLYMHHQESGTHVLGESGTSYAFFSFSTRVSGACDSRPDIDWILFQEP